MAHNDQLAKHSYISSGPTFIVCVCVCGGGEDAPSAGPVKQGEAAQGAILSHRASEFGPPSPVPGRLQNGVFVNAGGQRGGVRGSEQQARPRGREPARSAAESHVEIRRESVKREAANTALLRAEAPSRSCRGHGKNFIAVQQRAKQRW